MVGGRHGTRRADLHRRPAAVRELPGGSPLRVAAGRASRGRLLAVLRDCAGPVPGSQLEAAWADQLQRHRALDGLVADGLVDPLPDGRFALPGTGF